MTLACDGALNCFVKVDQYLVAVVQLIRLGEILI